MKSLFALVLVLGTTAFSAPTVYTCEGFAGVEEYRSTINLKTKTADFFDNDTTSTMKLTRVISLPTFPSQTQMMFEGKDETSGGKLLLSFNLTNLTASISTVNVEGVKALLGRADCQAASRR